MQTIASSFSDAIQCVTVNGEKRDAVIAAHTEVGRFLSDSEILAGWGIAPILTGSYARSTSIYPGNDVDIFARFRGLDASASPTELYDHVATVLRGAYGDRVEAEPPRRAVKVRFEHVGEDFSIDVVPAIPWEQNWAIPNRDRALWAAKSEGDRWVETNPVRLNEMTSAQNEMPTVNGRGAYVPVVKLLRQAREFHLGDARPSGFFFELMAYWAFEWGLSGSTFAELTAGALHSCAEQLDACVKGDMVVEPAMGTPFHPAPSIDDLSAARIKFADLAARAQHALDAADECEAAAIWRQITGRNERGWCISLPDGCDESGKRIESVSAVLSRGRREGGRYGRSRHA